MILHALAQYYERKSGVEEGVLPTPGFERKIIPVIIEISDQGNLVQVRVTDKDSSSSEYIVPQGVKKTSGVAANLLWDNVEYVFGLAVKGKPERVIKQHQAFIERIRSLDEPAKSDEGIQALLCFLENFDAATLRETPHWELLQSSPNISFRLQNDNYLICERQNVIETLRNNKGENAEGSVCLITGDDDEPERLHPAIKGVWGAQSSGANIVSFNLDSFTSYGKSQGLNAPVGKHASFAYTTALNHLLRKGSEQRFQVGDASTVCWSAKPNELESNLPTIFGTPIKDDPDKRTEAVKAVFKSVRQGSLAEGDDNSFYVLGLAPNASRIAIRFWLTGTVSEFSTRIKEHFDYLEIVRGENEPEYLSLFSLLVNTAVQRKADKIPPNLGGKTIRTILAGLPYPDTLFAAAIRRCKAKQNINYQRAAIIKAYLNKKTYLSQSHTTEVLKVALDRDNKDPSYRLGRLFATLERIQEEAAKPRVLKVTIKDSYYGSASSNPGSVFPTLLKLSHHRLAELRKKNPGNNTYFQKLIGEIMTDVTELPKILLLEGQGMFAIGYYHQRQDFFTKRNTSQPGEKA